MRWFAWSFLFCFLLALSLSLSHVLLIYTICYVRLHFMIFIMAHSENGFLRKPRRKTQNRWSYDTYQKIINESLWPFYFISLIFFFFISIWMYLSAHTVYSIPFYVFRWRKKNHCKTMLKFIKTTTTKIDWIQYIAVILIVWQNI